MKKLVLFVFIGLVFLQCTNNKPLPNGYELLDRDGKSGLMPPITLKPVRVAQFRKVSPTGINTTLLLGTHQGLTSSIVLNTRNFKSAAVDSTTNIEKLELHLYANALTDSNQTFTVSFYEVQKTWNERTVIADSLIGSIATTPLFSAELQPKKSSWTIVTLPDIEFFRAWIKDSYNTTPTMFGLALRAETDAMVQFASADASFFAPFIIVRSLKESGDQDSATVVLSADAGLLQSTDAADQLVVSPANLRVGAGSGYRSLIRFDLSAIPPDATIHQALLTFAVNGDSSSTRVAGQMNVSILAVSGDSTWQNPKELTTVSTSSVPFDVAVDTAENFMFDDSSSNLNSPVLYVSRTVQRWLNGVYDNFGFLIFPTDDGKDWQAMAFHSGVDDSLTAPTLTVTYSLPAENRFTNP